MKIIHLSDTHLGYREFHRIDPETGINQREQDVYNAFQAAVSQILDEGPDLVIHAGDLFDNVRPNNRAINQATAQFGRLAEAGIPTVVIAGNHDTPKISSTGTVLQSLDQLPNINAVTSDETSEGGYRRIPVGDMLVHAVADAPTEDELEERLESLQPDPEYRWNVVVIHAGIRRTDQAPFSGEFNEHHLSLRELDNKHWDYVALGHYHKRMKMDLPSGTIAHYPGATERYSFNETNYSPGFLKVEFSESGIHPQEKLLDTRTFVKLDPIDCRDLTAAEIERTIEDKLPKKEIMENGLLSLTLTEIDANTYSVLEENLLEQLRELAFETKFQIYGPEEEELDEESMVFSDLRAEFSNFMLERAKVDRELDRQKLIELGQRYLGEALGEEDG